MADDGTEDCEETLRELQLFLDGELAPAERTHVLTHLEECIECFHAYDFEAELKQIIALKCRTDVMPADLLDRIRQGLAEATQAVAAEPDSGPLRD